MERNLVRFECPSPSLRYRAGTRICGVTSFRGQDLVGFVLGRIEVYLDEEHFFLQEMCVVPELQRRGVGTLMLRHLHQRLEVEGCKQVYLLTARESSAERFYVQNGYRSARRTGVLVTRFL